MAKEYFDLMKKTSEVIHPVVDRSLKRFKYSKGGLYDVISQIPKSFFEQGSNFRTYLLRVSYQAVANDDWGWIAPIGASIEFLLASMYYSNWIQDEKGGKRSRDEDKNILTAAMLMRDLNGVSLYEIDKKLPLEKLVEVSCLFNESNRIFHEGQFIDINVNNYRNPKRPTSEQDMMDLYLDRTYKINAAFIERIARIGGLLAKGSEEEIDALGNFGKYFGVAHQVMNDVADFVPCKEGIRTTTKIPEDAYADIRQGHLTLPVIYTLFHDDNRERVSKIVSVLDGSRTQTEDLEEITNILLQNGAIDYTIRYARGVKRKAKASIKCFSEDKRRALNWLLVSIDSNKYYTALRNYQKNI